MRTEGGTSRPVVVVGAGIAGSTCARTLADAGVPVRLLERSRVPGGRMASRRVEASDGRERRVDLGASYFTVSDDRFAAQVARWEEAGAARRWTDTFSVRGEDGAWERKSGPLRWGAPGGLRSLVEDLAAGLDVQHHEVSAVRHDGAGLHVDGTPAAAVVLAMPDPQARRLLGPGERGGLDEEHGELTDPYQPILALTSTWRRRSWDDGPFADGAFVNGDPDLTWVADDGRRRGDDAAVLVAHTTPERARRHLEDPAGAAPELVASLRRLLALGEEPVAATVHRWTFAKPTRPRDAAYLLSERGLGVCGDGWAGGGKVEAAYLSGLQLGQALVERAAGAGS